MTAVEGKPERLAAVAIRPRRSVWDEKAAWEETRGLGTDKIQIGTASDEILCSGD